ncbi:MAG: hypothetical protein DMD66_14190 [Gemmatimonadetes bacterium]|nr:MAG: hypothetical protein DMD66_14190 [Gemmatimonadota bacterium]
MITAAVGLAGCFLEPDTGLSGQWGGRLIAMDAHPSDVRLIFVCSQAVAPPLLIDGSGHFEGTARVTEVRPTVLRLSGKVENGVMMTLSVASVWPPHGAQTDTLINYQSYTLLRGAAPDFSGWACLY